MADIRALFGLLRDALPGMISACRRDALKTARLKVDNTVVTDADHKIEQFIFTSILKFEPNPIIIGEESSRLCRRSDLDADRVWIVDPIDGTRQFADGNSREYCSVVGFIQKGRPSAALVVCPELGLNGTSLTIECAEVDDGVRVNGKEAKPARSDSNFVSVTRSRSSQPSMIEQYVEASGFIAKTQTTSQTLDMLRTSLDLSSCTFGQLPSFRAFYREQQNIWDGIAGLVIARAMGVTALDGRGRPISKVSSTSLSVDAGWTLPSTLLGDSYLIGLLVPFLR